MNDGVPLFPDQASSMAPSVDALYFFLLGVAGFFTLLIFIAIVFLSLYYRRSSERNRTRSHTGNVWLLEAAWIGVPFALTMIMFFWGAKIYFDVRTIPNDAIEIQVVGKQWMWKVRHPRGRSEINELHVPVNQPIRLRMISEDVIHSFYIPAFRVKMDVLPTRYSSLWFEPTRRGEYYLFCAEYCGTDHAKMSGRVHVMGQAEYAEWASRELEEVPESPGARLFTEFRCHSCHHEGPTAVAPTLKGLFGDMVTLADGQQVEADVDYLRESIVNPARKVTAGYQPVMPTFDQQLTEEQILQLIDYIKTLTPDAADSPSP